MITLYTPYNLKIKRTSDTIITDASIISIRVNCGRATMGRPQPYNANHKQNYLYAITDDYDADMRLLNVAHKLDVYYAMSKDSGHSTYINFDAVERVIDALNTISKEADPEELGTLELFDKIKRMEDLNSSLQSEYQQLLELTFAAKFNFETDI